MAGLVGDEAAVPADVALLPRPETHTAPAHLAHRAPGQRLVSGHMTSHHLQLDVLSDEGVVHVDVELRAFLLELPPLGGLHRVSRV